MRSLSRVVKGKKAIDVTEMYQFFSDFALEEEKEEAPETEGSSEEEPDQEETLKAAREEEAREREEASEILANARKEADQLLEDARRQAELLREESFAQGHQEGYEAGVLKARQECEQQYEEEVQDFRTHAAEFMDSIRLEKSALMEKYLDDLKRIVLTIAEKVIHISLRSSENVIHRMIIAATDKLKKTEWAKIYITKCGTEISMEADVEFLNALSHLSDNVKIVAMDSEEEGICVIELPEEIIDASVSTQLENIKDILNNARI
ncbi:MAG: hypothetical protein HFI29_14800 [Lachnospiraceae bacterium]|jgi:flagellar assembly protein FliH|nr:hypothetical protein [Lachnospiraceae bacterium]